MEEIKVVIQVADIHIRPFQRMGEYAEQLEKFINKCKEIVEPVGGEHCRILICGDLFHSKLTISTELFPFASMFIRQIEQICPVLIYSGNHDMIVTNDERKDTVTSLFETAGFTNTTFLDMETGYESGIIQDNNITWALYSIHDDFQKPDLSSVEEGTTVIGLFHGTIVGCTLDDGSLATDGINKKSFDGCQIVMAGHIHKRQTIKLGKTKIVYPGSLIQQNFGETITQHGFAVWNIEKKTCKFIDIDTSHGMYDFRISSIDDIDNDEEKLLNY